jgi:NAD(P)-dependent dehydrogenase (short-subunit alcohol dehydrogenase family)
MAETQASKQLAGKFAVVTGGTQGLGETIARLFAERGAAGIVICGRKRERGLHVAESLSTAGCPTSFVEADLGRVEDCRRVIAEADRRFGKLHALVNVAALTDRGTILDTSPELFDRIFAVNVRAPFFLMQDAAKIMRRTRTEGAIVNILSMSGHGGQPFLSAYSTSKGALATLTRNTAFSLLPDRIRVNGLNIGWMDTPGEHAIQASFHHAPADWLAKAEAAQPFGRLLKPTEVASAVCFLCSAEAGLMTGSIIDFDQQVLGCAESAPHPTARLADPS